jgi:hypothetical protein
MTAEGNRAIADLLAKVATAVAAFPATAPEFSSVNVNTSRYQPYDARLWLPTRSYLDDRLKDPRDLAGMAAAVQAPVHIKKKPYSSSRAVVVEFDLKGVRFHADCDITTADARAVAKALKRKLPTNEDALEMTAAELAQAITALESA